MIDLKQLRRRISGEPNEQGVLGPTWLCPRESMKLIDALEAAQKDTASCGWIDVDERYPEKNTEVLIAFSKSTLPATGQYTGSPRDNDAWCYPAENDPDEVGCVTHWMPLPKPPAV